MRRAFAVMLGIAALLSAAPSSAQDRSDEDRPTVQRRYAVKRSSVYLHGTGTTHLRNDFYNTFGGGLDLGVYPWESLGFELRALFLDARLSSQAREIQENTGLTPDARPQSMIATVGARWSWGYGKILALNWAVLHFDPQLVLGLGVARAETRWLPSAVAGLGLLVHLRWGLQVKLDLNASVQSEQRTRGWVTSVGFMPLLGIGWNVRLGGRG